MLAVGTLGPETLALGITAVLGGTNALLMGEELQSNVHHVRYAILSVRCGQVCLRGLIKQKRAAVQCRTAVFCALVRWAKCALVHSRKNLLNNSVLHFLMWGYSRCEGPPDLGSAVGGCLHDLSSGLRDHDNVGLALDRQNGAQIVGQPP